MSAWDVRVDSVKTDWNEIDDIMKSNEMAEVVGSAAYDAAKDADVLAAPYFHGTIRKGLFGFRIVNGKKKRFGVVYSKNMKRRDGTSVNPGASIDRKYKIFEKLKRRWG